MPCSAAIRVSSSGSGLAAPTARTKASKAAGVDATSERVPSAPGRSVCGVPRGANAESPGRRTLVSSPTQSVISPSRT